MANKPKVVFYSTKRQHWAQPWCEAMRLGLRRHGITLETSAEVFDYNPQCDIAVMWGMRHPQLIKALRSKRIEFLVLERGYFRDRFAYTSIGWNGLNGEADFNNSCSPPDRWKKHGVKIKFWNTGGDYILITGQVPGDATVRNRNLVSEYQWLSDQLRALSDLPVVFKPHPLADEEKYKLCPVGIECMDTKLQSALAGAALVVTINSNSAVDAILAGVPVISTDPKCMAYSVSRHRLTRANVRDPYKPNRYQWLNNLAYAQWNNEEIAKGLAWAHLSELHFYNECG